LDPKLWPNWSNPWNGRVAQMTHMLGTHYITPFMGQGGVVVYPFPEKNERP